MTTRKRLVVGCMTGTSLDGLDAALVEIDGFGLGMTPRFVRGLSRPLGSTGPALRRIAQQTPMPAGDIARTALELGELHALAVAELLSGARCDLICVHGQTVFHQPPVSWQLINVFPIVRTLAAPVVFDLRQADLVAGGQGAPITPIADAIWLRAVRVPWAVINLGGFCNVTLGGGGGGSVGSHLGAIRASDVCACNQLLDCVAREALGCPFDDRGSHALRGTVNPAALADLARLLGDQQHAGRSLGTGDEAGHWVRSHRASLSGPDLAATACEGIAARIIESVRGASELYLAGGGEHNHALVAAISRLAAGASGASVVPLASLGLPGAFREAAHFAVLGALCQDRVPITLPAVTGVRVAPISGAWVMP
ncbi:MAG: hypothetical protein DYG92_06840 [Leptolyngbya sp. PLA1]|nr:hypothetical protein [Leptolyngbya sp. PLA1]